MRRQSGKQHNSNWIGPEFRAKRQKGCATGMVAQPFVLGVEAPRGEPGHFLLSAERQVGTPPPAGRKL